MADINFIDFETVLVILHVNSVICAKNSAVQCTH